MPKADAPAESGRVNFVLLRSDSFPRVRRRVFADRASMHSILTENEEKEKSQFSFLGASRHFFIYFFDISRIFGEFLAHFKPFAALPLNVSMNFQRRARRLSGICQLIVQVILYVLELKTFLYRLCYCHFCKSHDIGRTHVNMDCAFSPDDNIIKRYMQTLSWRAHTRCP